VSRDPRRPWAADATQKRRPPGSEDAPCSAGEDAGVPDLALRAKSALGSFADYAAEDDGECPLLMNNPG